MSANQVRVGDVAPDFALPDQSGKIVRLRDLRRGQVVVLYFYPADDTPVCTREACAFRDSYQVFAYEGAQVVGISRDSVESHQRFTTKHSLPFVLLSDEQSVVHRMYGVKRSFLILPGRMTFVIDSAGVVRHSFASLTRVGPHVDNALAVVRQLAG